MAFLFALWDFVSESRLWRRNDQRQLEANAFLEQRGEMIATHVFVAKLVHSKFSLPTWIVKQKNFLQGFAACTLKGCLKQGFGHVSSGPRSNLRIVTLEEYYDPNFTCTPLETFKLDCNNCGCSDDGKKVSWCTKKKCVQNVNVL